MGDYKNRKNPVKEVNYCLYRLRRKITEQNNINETSMTHDSIKVQPYKVTNMNVASLQRVPRILKVKMATVYSFQAKVASRGYHIFKETTWVHASVGDHVIVEPETNQTSRHNDPYACAIKNNDKVVGHKPREISRHV